mgnify:CR=1 FL=1
MHKLTILFVLSMFLIGCGQKGPLYHPQPEQESNQSKLPQQDPSKPELTKDTQ